MPTLQTVLPEDLRELPAFLEELDDYLEREYLSLESTSGLTGHESDDDFDTPEDRDSAHYDLQCLRQLLGFRAHINQFRLALRNQRALAETA